MFGRRRLVPAEKHEKGAAAGVVTETRPAGVVPRRQARWLALGALAIVGPVAALALGAFQPRRVPREVGSVAPAAGSLVAMMSAAPAVDSGAPAPQTTAAPVVEEDAGAGPATTGAPAVTASPSGVRPAPSGAGVKLGPRGPRPKSTEDPYVEPSVKPRKPDPGANIW
jgi:hypothetical protein